MNQIIAAYTGWVDKRNELGKSVTFGDGKPLPKDVIDDINSYMNENKCAYVWEHSQFVLVDNTVCYHSRNSFEGKRVVYAAIANGTKEIPFK
mmetsp:Transcript_31634/g.30939  ORF Transcript_31634/g.30939 Transcript_31634/m.30939 type:complete len:92 (+) Transcript_31634:799-1074(+)